MLIELTAITNLNFAQICNKTLIEDSNYDTYFLQQKMLLSALFIIILYFYPKSNKKYKKSVYAQKKLLWTKNQLQLPSTKT